MYKELAAELRTISAEIEEYNINNPRGEQLDSQIVDVIRMVDMTTVDKVCSESHSWSKDEEGYFLIKLFEIVMSQIDDRATQRILRDVDNTKLKAIKAYI